MDSTLQEGLNDLFKEFEETKKSNKKLSEFIAILQEELQLARDAEKTAECKKARCESFLNQQQEIIQRLLVVKEEKENLKCQLQQAQVNLSMIQNNSIEEQMKKDAKIQEIEQEFLKKVRKIQEKAAEQTEKEKAQYLDTIGELKTSVSELEEKIMEKDASIVSLKEEIQTLKAWSDANMEAFHEKLAEQERKHQSELETWKMAEVNRSMFEQHQQSHTVTQYGPIQNQYQPSQSMRPGQGYQPKVRFQEQMISYQKTPLVTHYKSVPPRQNTNMVRPLASIEHYQNKSDFISASELYMHNRQPLDSDREEKDESGEENIKGKKQVGAQKSNILLPNKRRKLFSHNPNML